VPILKLCDFGYSKNSWLGSLPKTRVGTAAYIPPEVARASINTEGYDTEKSDVWSTGITLYCMLAGHYPFSQAGGDLHLQRIKELTDADVADALARIPDISPACKALIRCMLIIDPSQRISWEGIMQDAWFRQFLPDISKVTAGQQRREVQAEDAVRQILSQAESISAEKRTQRDEFDEEDGSQGIDDMLDAANDDGTGELILGGYGHSTLDAGMYAGGT